MADEIKREGLDPKDAERIEAFTSAVRTVVDDGLSARGFVDEKAVEGIVEKSIKATLMSRLPTSEGEKERSKWDFYSKFLPALARGDAQTLNELWTNPKYADQWSEKATLVSGGTTYSNVMPQLIYNDILTYANELTWHRQYCRVLTGAPNGGTFPVGASTRCTAYRRTEGSSTTDSAPQMSGHSFTLIPLSVQLPVSNELAKEWSVPVFYNWLVSEMAYAKAIKEFAEFTTGNDTSAWDGVENSITTGVTTSSSLLIDKLGDLYMDLPAMFRPRGTFWCDAATMVKVWGAVDGAGHRVFPAGAPLNTLFGRPLLENSEATADEVYFGDLNRYHIYVGDAFMKADDTGATNVSQNQTMFFLNESNDGGPADDNAFRFVTV